MQLPPIDQQLHERDAILNLAPEAIFVRDLGGVIRYWNYGAEKIYGWTAEEAMGHISHKLLETHFHTLFQRSNPSSSGTAIGRAIWFTTGETAHAWQSPAGGRFSSASQGSLPPFWKSTATYPRGDAPNSSFEEFSRLRRMQLSSSGKTDASSS